MEIGNMVCKNLTLVLVVTLFTVRTAFSQENFDLFNTEKIEVSYEGESRVIDHAIDMFLNDVESVSGLSTERVGNKKKYTVIVINLEEVDKASYSKEFIQKNNIDISGLEGEWEAFRYQPVTTEEGESVLAILGSDKRGTVYGLLELSRKMGVSPWVWWADVTIDRKEVFKVKDTAIHKPDVKYRGVFLNDEDWGLIPWASKTFEPEVGNIGPKTYAKIFELLLRLKANTIWPAMHPGTKAFFQVEGNRKIAEEYAISIGTSHAEPMLRNNVGEWDSEKMGDFNYLTNKDSVYKYWEDRVQEAANGDNIYTLGMRGIHDGQMQGTSSTEEVIEVMSGIFEDQRGMLKKYVNKQVENVPQAFVPYKEVLEIYDNGLKVPEDVTLVWPDDNYGYIRRLSNAKERKRKGGAGVYYHISYWGQPHDYLWLSTHQPGLIWEEMTKAWRYGARDMWIVNVGDIKPAAYNTQFFLDLAWNVNSMQPDALNQYMENWHTKIFGAKNGKAITEVMEEYYRLASIRKPEFMGWSQTEPITETTDTEFEPFLRGDEINRRIKAYSKIVSKVNDIEPNVAEDKKDAFYELVTYPVQAAAAMNKKILYAQKSRLFARYGLSAANKYADSAETAYETIKNLTEAYNNDLADGKWNHMMDMAPRGLPVFDEPDFPKEIANYFGGTMIWLEGDSQPYDSNKVLPKFNPYNATTHFVQLLNKGSYEISWEVESKDEWITLDKLSGEFNEEYRLNISVDWSKVPENTTSGSIKLRVGKDYYQLKVLLERVHDDLSEEEGVFIEQNGKVFLQAADFVKKKDMSKAYKWGYIDQLGYNNKAYTLLPIPVGQSKNMDEAYLKYRFYTYSKGPAEINLYTIPTHPVNDLADVRIAVSVDDAEKKSVSFKEKGRTEQWKQNVLRNHALNKFKVEFEEPGWHTLKVYPLDPGVILDQIMIDVKPEHQIYAVPSIFDLEDKK